MVKLSSYLLIGIAVFDEPRDRSITGFAALDLLVVGVFERDAVFECEECEAAEAGGGGGGGNEGGGGGRVLLTGAFVALLGDVSELLWSGFGVVVFPARYCPSLNFFVAIAAVEFGVEPFVETFGVLAAAAESGSGLSRRYFPVYSGRSSSVVYS